MKKIISCFILILYANILLSQTPQMNLQKYWTYRERLKYFINKDNANLKGTNIPADRIYIDNDKTTIDFGDGNATMQDYIGILATEYKLLKMNGLDYSQTRQDLYWALKTVERLDITAESYWRDNHTIDQTNDLNGFFIRDDVTNDASYWKNILNKSDVEISSTYTERVNATNPRGPYEMSKDNVWHYLPNLALVKKLVDDPELNDMAVDISYRIIKIMHNKLEYCFDIGILTHTDDYSWWGIKNPITNFRVEDGYDVEEPQYKMTGNSTWSIGRPRQWDMVGFNYGFAEAGNWITDKKHGDLHYCYSSGNFHLFDRGKSARYNPTLSGILQYEPDNYSYRALASVANIVEQGSLYDDMIRYRRWETGENNSTVHYRLNNNLPYEQFPLIAALLHGRGNTFNNEYYYEKGFYENLLNSAHECGTYNFGANINKYGLPPRPDDWSCDNRLIWPEDLNKDGKIGYYSGIDYMLLFNLYWLNYQTKEILNSIVYRQGSWLNNILNYFGKYDNIVSNINMVYDINYTAQTSIKLTPGFQTNGYEFTAKINPPTGYYDYTTYSKLAPCYTCPLMFAEDGPKSSKLEENSKNLTFDKKRDVVVNIYPNPTPGSFKVSINTGSLKQIEVYTMQGSLLESYSNIGTNYYEINENLHSGFYLVNVVTETGEKFTRKLVVE